MNFNPDILNQVHCQVDITMTVTTPVKRSTNCCCSGYNGDEEKQLVGLLTFLRRRQLGQITGINKHIKHLPYTREVSNCFDHPFISHTVAETEIKHIKHK